ncbi:MAG: bifunctional diguanylate cyclase/phosphodiesterase [Hyphomicrobiales bacterium]|nr:MAG: bifunctional diguanylate cyclase/phosphodiesterase [Hyphomicrobiales bacterium]
MAEGNSARQKVGIDTDYKKSVSLHVLAPVAALFIAIIVLTGLIAGYLALNSDKSLTMVDRSEIQVAFDELGQRIAREHQQAVNEAQGTEHFQEKPERRELFELIAQHLMSAQHHLVPIILPDGDSEPLVFGVEQLGMRVEPEAILSDIVPLFTSEAWRGDVPRRMAAGSWASQTRTGFLTVAGKPALVVINWVPGGQHIEAGSDDGLGSFRLASVVFIDNAVLSSLNKSAGLAGLHLDHPDHEHPHHSKTVLADPAGNAIATLLWDRDLPGQDWIRDTAPYALVGVTLILGLIILILRAIGDAATQLKASQNRALTEALTDPLTKAPNRHSFVTHLETALAEAKNGGRCPSVIYVDIDQFKQFNDTLGHDTGDAIIRAALQHLRSHCHDGDLIARIGSDEFAILSTENADREAMERAASRITAAFNQPLEFGEHTFPISLAIGSTRAPEDGDTAEELMRRADIALHHAKRDKSRVWVHFQPSMEKDVRLRHEIVSDLRNAIANDELSLNYQPLMTSDGKTAVGVEALLRWTHPERGPVSPAVFIPIAEEHRLIGEIGRWVLKTACRDAAAWPHLSLAVNISPLQIRQTGFVEDLMSILEEADFDPTRLEIEVTENVVLDHADTASTIFDAIHQHGIRIALDDFGTGYSSLSYLERFRFDKLKIDRSFLRNIETSRPAAAIVHTVIALGDALDVTITAEGVETPGQHRFLQAAGCHQLQGFLFSKPVTADVISERFATEQVDETQNAIARSA